MSGVFHTLNLGRYAKVKTGFSRKRVNRFYHQWPIIVVVIARNEPANLDFSRPLPNRLTAFLTGMRISVDVYEIQTLIVKQVICLSETHS